MSWDELYEFITNAEVAIRKGGYVALLSIVFAENGIILGIFLPGDYLLFTAGLLCGTGVFDVNIYILLLAVWAAAVGGALVGYLTGQKVGKPFFQKESLFLKHKHIIQTRAYFFRFGGKTILVSKFLPIVRTIAPILAGTVEMPFNRFMLYNMAGAVLWVGILVGGGYKLGDVYGKVLLDYLEYIILGFIVLTSSVVVISYLKTQLSRKKTSQKDIYL